MLNLINELVYYVFRFLIWNRTMWFIGTKNDLESTITTNSTTTTTTTTTTAFPPNQSVATLLRIKGFGNSRPDMDEFRV